MADSPNQPGLGGLDFGALMKQAESMKSHMDEASDKLASTVFSGSAGEKVVVEVTGDYAFQSVTIDASAVDPDDVELLEDLVLAALRDAADQIVESQSDTLGGLGVPDLGGLGQMFGGDDE